MRQIFETTSEGTVPPPLRMWYNKSRSDPQFKPKCSVAKACNFMGALPMKLNLSSSGFAWSIGARARPIVHKVPSKTLGSLTEILLNRRRGNRF